MSTLTRPGRRSTLSFELEYWLNNNSLDSAGSSASPFDVKGNYIAQQEHPQYLPPYQAQNIPSEPTPPQTNDGYDRPQCLLRLLKNASQASSGVVIDNGMDTKLDSISYEDLLEGAMRRAKHFPLVMALQQSTTKMVLLYMDNHRDYLLYFWTVLAAGGIPCMSSEFPPDAVKRQTYISNIHRHLNYPIVLTTDKLHKDYSGLKNLRLLTTSAIEAGLFNPIYSDPGSVFDKTEKDTGVVMVSQSGDGKAKAISLTNGQILASIEGKIQLHSTNKEDIFLAWSGLDHVSNLIEVHLHALCLSAIQVFLPYHLAVSDPMRFLKSLEKYQISYTHVPDFFLKELLKVLNSLAIQVRFEGDPVEMTFDFSKLRALVSQGRLNNSSTNSKALELFSKYKAPPRFLRPGFGMTEFCGSAIYDILEPITAVPTSQSLTLTSFFQTVDPKLEPTSQNTIGKPIPTLSVRIVDEDHYALPFGEVGMLELSGPCVFTSYYNDPQRTAKMFTRDGWFRTGDLGVFDTQGRTILSGRYEDRLIIRGKQYHPQNLQKHIRNQNIPGIKARSIVVFCFHPNEIEGDMLDWEAAGVKQENLVVVYATNFPKHMSGTALDTEHRVVGIMVDACGMVPYRILGVEEEQLPKTGGGFGRVSNMLVKRKFLKGGFGL